MFRLAIIVIAVVGVVISLVLGFLLLIPWAVSGVLVAIFIGIPSLVLTYLSSKEKEGVQETKSLEREPEKQEQSRQPRTILEETCVVDEGEYFAYDLDLKKGEELKGKISSDERINFFFLTKYGLTRFENNEDFSYDYGSESIIESKVHFTPLKTGILYLVLENEGENKATITVHLFV